MVLSKNILLLLFLYFIQGLPYGYQASFLPTYLYTQGVSLSSIGLFKLLLAPWLCKAIWAPLVDKYGTKHRWLLYSIGGLIVSCAAGIFISPHQTTALSIVLLALNICAATQDIAVDAIAVAILEDSEIGTGNTAQVVGYKIGSVFGGGVLVWFIDTLGWSGLFTALTILYIEAWMFVYVSPSLRELDSKMKQAANNADVIYDYSNMEDFKWEKVENSSMFTETSSSTSLFPEQSLRKRKQANEFGKLKEFYKEEDINTSDDDFPDSAQTLHARLIKKAKYRARKARDLEVQSMEQKEENKQSNIECDICNSLVCTCTVDNLKQTNSQKIRLNWNEEIIKLIDEEIVEVAEQEVSPQVHSNDLFSKLQRRHTVSESEVVKCDESLENGDGEISVEQCNSRQSSITNIEEYIADDEKESSSGKELKSEEIVKEEKGERDSTDADVLEEQDDQKEKGSSVIIEEEEDHEQQGFAFFRQSLSVPGTKWMIILVLVYKLGEQGALSLVPMFLVDQGVRLNDVTFWKGLIGQGFSIVGSLLGGWLMAKLNVPLYLLLQQMCLLRLLPLGGFLLVVSCGATDILPKHYLYYASIPLLIFLLLLGGIVTTVTFSLMMHCSKTAPVKVQATHYTLLATLEVLGKLMFSSCCGWILELSGYPLMFAGLIMLAGGVMPWFQRCPEELMYMGCRGGDMGNAEEEPPQTGRGDHKQHIKSQ